MSFLETLLSGNTAKERKKKQICAIVIAATAFLLAISIIAFAICQVVDATMHLTSNKEKDDTETEAPVDLGETTTIQLSEKLIYSGNLLTLSNDNHYNEKPVLIDIESARKERDPEPFISLYKDKHKLMATPDTANNLFDMVIDSNKALKNENGEEDDNLFLSNAYHIDKIESQDGIYSSGEAVAIGYCFNSDINNIHPINEEPKYKWIYNNAHKYGFIAVSKSSNVFRYVGKQHAAAAKFHGLYLNNYLKKLKQATIENPLKLDAAGTAVAYYCPINDVKVPKNYSYVISGDNVNGVIITVSLTSSSNNTADNNDINIEEIE